MRTVVFPSPIRSAVAPLTAFAALLPLIVLGLFWSFVLRARVALGEWPAPYRPDPKDLGFDVHMGAVLVGLVVAAASPFLFGWVLVVRRAVLGTWERAPRWGLVFALAFAVFFVVVRADPGSFGEWLMD